MTTSDNSQSIEYYAEDFGNVTEFSAREMGVLDEVNRYIVAGRNLKEILAYLFGALRSISPCDRLALAFAEEGEDRVTAHWAKAAYDKLYLDKGYAEHLSGSSLERVIEKGEPRVINDLEAYLETKPRSVSTKLVLREGLRSSMTCPLVVEGRRVGLLFNSSCQKNAYGHKELMMHSAVAERISQAVEKAWIIEQLEDARNSYAEMLGFVSHEFKSPLSSIVMMGNSLCDGLYGDVSEEAKEKIGRIKIRANYLIGLVKEYLDLARIESGELQVTKKEVNDFVEEVFEPAREIVLPQIEEGENRIVLNVFPESEKISLQCDASLLQIVLVNFLANAVKYGTPKSEIQVKINLHESYLRFSVRNEGPGFPESMKSGLFKKFSRLQTKELLQKKGTGVGLYSCRRIVSLHGGRVGAESAEGKWAEFFFEIPVA